MRLSDAIEAFIKAMLEEDQSEVELKRNELAAYFHCAPSQINYVLSTRFTPDHGYAISSQRGGGGCIRIVRVRSDDSDHAQYVLRERVGDSLDAQTARRLCGQLMERGAISEDEAHLMAAALCPQAFSVPVPENVKDALRAKVFKSMLLNICQRRSNAT